MYIYAQTKKIRSKLSWISCITSGFVSILDNPTGGHLPTQHPTDQPSTKNHGEIGKTQSISYHLDLFHYRPLWKCARKKGACL